MIYPIMIVSPGETEIAADSIARLLQAPVDLLPLVTVVLNGVDAGWLSAGVKSSRDRLRPVRLSDTPEPYVRFGRNLLGQMMTVPAGPNDLIVKVDPDTVVNGPRYVADLVGLHQQERADFYFFSERYQWSNDLRRTLRVCLDQLPCGLGRKMPSPTERLPSRLTFRRQPVWHCTLSRPACLRFRLSLAQPAGGFHALSGAMRDQLADCLPRMTSGDDGLEWNDDTILPIAVRGRGGKVCDLRDTTLAARWRWARGSRYFELEHALCDDWSVLHPLKNNPADRTIRAALPPADGIRFSP